MDMEDINEKIVHYSRQLRLPGFRKNYQSLQEEMSGDKMDYNNYLGKLLELEYQERIERRKKLRIKLAGFPELKYLQELSLDDLPKDVQEKLPSLRSLDFITNGQNIILAGNPGTGKSHVATGLGLEACMKGYKVLFVTVPQLITQIRESRSERRLRTLENRFEKFDLVICDEFGYISFDKEGAELLFTHLSLRTGKKSTIITTNLSFDRWSEIFGDPVLTAAMVDRITHRAHIINMNGKSYRAKETKEWNKK
ncbi:MAG: AAA family ATPase [Bacteroidetes bacterium]|jgi:DNA replication protein DnaC|nr:MAG: AAA family ATPase [Bacteroidota bacterium]